jgi:uracil-DNA glycosylase family 4
MPVTKQPSGIDELLPWAAPRLPVVLQSSKGATLKAATLPEMKIALRKLQLHSPGRISAQGADAAVLSASTKNVGSIAHVVPPVGPQRAQIAFVGLHPSLTDAARGEPFTGPDGACLIKQYLAPLGLKKGDVRLTYVYPAYGCDDPKRAVEWSGWIQDELARTQPLITVALGKHAKDALGKLADFTLPHPSAVRKSADDAQLLRRLKAVQAHRVAMSNKIADVNVVKKEDEERVIYGVVLDPYQYDTQGDHVPVASIQATSHDFIANSRTINLRHALAADAVVVESWLWPYPSREDYRNAMANKPHKAFAAKFGSDVVRSGAWVLGTKVLDDDTWRAIQAGELTAYSIGGTGIRTPEPGNRENLPEVTFIEA